MEKERIRRYLSKLEAIDYRSSLLSDWLNEIALDAVDEKTRFAAYKAFQEIIEAFMDIIAMMCRDSNVLPNDDYANISNLEKTAQVSSKTGAILREMNGLRNRLVHRYDQVDDQRALYGIQKIHYIIPDLMKEVKAWIKTHQ